MPDFTIEFVAHSETEVTKEKRVTNRTRRARYFGDRQGAEYIVHPSGVLEVVTAAREKDGSLSRGDSGELSYAHEYFAQGEWIRVYDGEPKVVSE
jgi:hypothetical protein